MRTKWSRAASFCTKYLEKITPKSQIKWHYKESKKPPPPKKNWMWGGNMSLSIQSILNIMNKGFGSKICPLILVVSKHLLVKSDSFLIKKTNFIFVLSAFFFCRFWFPGNNLRIRQPIIVKFSGIFLCGTGKNPIGFGHHHSNRINYIDLLIAFGGFHARKSVPNRNAQRPLHLVSITDLSVEPISIWQRVLRAVGIRVPSVLLLYNYINHIHQKPFHKDFRVLVFCTVANGI